jgi:tetratricopeptide (TPR) repeat protein
VQASYGYRSEDAVLAEAEQAIAKALELNSSLAEAWASAGLIAWDRNQFARAEQMLRRAITLNPNLAPAHHWLSRALTDLGRRDEALAAAERAVVLDPLSAIINISLGEARSSVGRFNDALLAFKQAIEIDPALPLSYRNIGEVYAYGFGRFDSAMPWYKESVRLDPGASYAAALVTLTHWELGDDVEAARGFHRLEAMRLETAFTNFAAALLYLDRGDKTSARRHAQRAAEADPVFTFLVRDGTRRGGYADARARYAKAFPILFATKLRTLTDREAFAAVDLALVLQHTREGQRASVLMDRAEADLRTMPRMGPGGYWLYDVAIHALRGDTAMALKKLREAEQAGWRAWWRYYRDFDPNLASIRNEPEFKAVFADIERDMAKQRAALAARPKDAPLDLGDKQ